MARSANSLLPSPSSLSFLSEQIHHLRVKICTRTTSFVTLEADELFWGCTTGNWQFVRDLSLSILETPDGLCRSRYKALLLSNTSLYVQFSPISPPIQVEPGASS